MNVKFPAPSQKMPIQRNSFMALSKIQKVPPGFENFPTGNPKPKLSSFATNNSLAAGNLRGKSPPNQELEHPVVRKPNSKRSQQNFLKPLVSGLDSKSDFSLYKDLGKERLSSDSLSDDADQDYIKEEEEDGTEEEKYSTTSSTRPKAKLSSDRLCK